MSNQQLTFDPPEKREGKLILSLRIPGRLPTWNDVLGMQHWSRHKLKSLIQVAFLSALSATVGTSSTKTTSAKNIMWTAYATLACYHRMIRAERILKSRNKRLNPGPKKKWKSKLSPYRPKPPF